MKQRAALLLSLLCATAACGEDAKTVEPILIIEERPDMAVEPDQATTPDQEPDLVEEPDMAPDQSTDPVVAAEPEGRVFLHDPVTDNRQTTIVKLPRPDNEAGILSNQATHVYNCINEPGEPLSFQGFAVGNLCKEIQLVRPAADGHYLQYMPPAQDSDPNDSFAEVQMYYHVNQIWSYLVNTLGVTWLNMPIDALPNVQFYTNAQAAGFLGTREGWSPFDNAAYMFPDAFQQLGLPARDRGAIVFGQTATTDFSYDASVIYHEFTHAMIGEMRFTGAFPDEVGLNNTPGAINEGLADYFATSLMDDPVVGHYGLASFGPGLERDLSQKRACPADLSTEVHEDGKIIGSAMWSLRAQLGKEVTDRIVMRSIAASNQGTGFDQFGALVQAQANAEGPAVAATTAMVLAEHGLNGCDRAREWANWRATSVPFSAPGPQDLGTNAFRSGVPGYLQFFLENPPEGKVAVLTWDLQAAARGAAPRLQAAVRQGQPVALNVSFNGATITEDKRFNPAVTNAQGGQRQTMTLAQDCFTQGQRTYVMLVNTGTGANIVRTAIQYIDAASAPDLQSCAP
jgi:hypothetical protein